VGHRWHVSGKFLMEECAEQEQLVEIHFTAKDRGTRVELTHSRWEKLSDAATNLRERYQRGWATVSSVVLSTMPNAVAT
jgi:hypothetical protein